VTNTILPLTDTITPAEEAAVVGAVRAAHDSATAVYPIGGGTRLGYGAAASRPGIGLSLRQLCRVIDHSPQDLTVTVEAGVTWAELTQRLAAEKQRLPFDVPDGGRATVGGILATSLNGPRQFACGAIQDYVLGIRAVDGRGTAFAGGGRVLKNAAGYNMCRLLVGSLGAFGVITQATLMTRPMPETSAFATCDLADFDAAEKLLSALLHTQTLPVAVELLIGPVWPINGGLSQFRAPCKAWSDENGTVPLSSAHAKGLLVGFEGSAAEVQWMIDQIGQEWRQLGVDSSKIVLGADADFVWDELIGFAAEVQISVLPGKLIGLIDGMLQSQPGCSILSHAGNGVLLVRLPPTLPERFSAAIRQLRAMAVEAGGKMSVLARPEGVALSREDTWGPPGGEAAVMRSIKGRFDPKNILNPGRYIF
jgi:glycolate oxidase FAD binding subunit